MTEYTLSYESETKPLANGMVRLDIWTTSYSGFDDPGFFLLHRNRSLVNGDAPPVFETFANPCTMVEYPYRFVERNYGLYRDRSVSLTFNSAGEARTFSDALENRRMKLLAHMNQMSQDIETAVPVEWGVASVVTSSDKNPYMMIKCVSDDPIFVFQDDKGGFSRFVGIDGHCAEKGVGRKELAVITYSTRAPIFLDLLKEDLVSTD